MRFSYVPFWFYLGVGYVVIVAMAFPFLLGNQYEPYNNNYPVNSTNPECRLFHDIEAGISGRNLDVLYKIKSRFNITHQMSWRLLRLFVNGSFVHEEIRSNSDVGIFSFRDKLIARFEIQQEGNISVHLYCLDMCMASLEVSMEPTSNISSYTVFHNNGDTTNMCVNKSERIVFGRVTHRNLTERFEKDVAAVFYQQPINTYIGNNSKIDLVTSHGLVDMNTCTSSYDLLTRVFPWIYSLAKRDLDIALNVDNDRWPGMDHVIHKLTGFPPAETLNNRLSQFCWKNTRSAKMHLANDKTDFLEMRERMIGYGDNSTSIIVYNERHISEVGPENDEDVKLELARYGDLHSVRLSDLTISEKVDLLKRASIFVSDDDGNEIVHALWMPRNSTVILLKDPSQTEMSRGHAFLSKIGINVIVIKGTRLDTENDPEEEQEEFMGSRVSENQYMIQPEKVKDVLHTL